MLFQKDIIFVLLKVVRDGDLEQAYPRIHNKTKAYSSSGQPSKSAYLMRFFYCVINENILSMPNIARTQISSVRLHNTLKRAFPAEGSSKLPLLVKGIITGCRNDLFQPLERSEGDKRPTTVAINKKWVTRLFNGVTGFCDLFFHFSQKISLPRTVGFTLIF